MTTHNMTADQKKAVQTEFHRLVNMSQARLRDWLSSDDSRSVGMTAEGAKVTDSNGPEAVGHHMGERILTIRGQKNDELNEEDFADMRKVVGYIHRHAAQRPSGDITNSRWRKSLMNWGHDPV